MGSPYYQVVLKPFLKVSIPEIPKINHIAMLITTYNLVIIPANKRLLKVKGMDNKDRRCSGIFIVNFEHISYLF